MILAPIVLSYLVINVMITCMIIAHDQATNTKDYGVYVMAIPFGIPLLLIGMINDLVLSKQYTR